MKKILSVSLITTMAVCAAHANPRAQISDVVRMIEENPEYIDVASDAIVTARAVKPSTPKLKSVGVRNIKFNIKNAIDIKKDLSAFKKLDVAQLKAATKGVTKPSTMSESNSTPPSQTSTPYSPKNIDDIYDIIRNHPEYFAQDARVYVDTKNLLDGLVAEVEGLRYMIDLLYDAYNERDYEIHESCDAGYELQSDGLCCRSGDWGYSCY